MSSNSKNSQTLAAAVSSVPLPSSDLIQYRFDQIDAKLEKFDQKLDLIGTAYMPRHEADERYTTVTARLTILESKAEKLKQTDDRQQGAINSQHRLTTIGLTLLGIAAAVITTFIGMGK